MPVTASAPAKVILLGEHAVVYGEPAVAVALDLRTRVTVEPQPGAPTSTVNGNPVHEHYHTHLKLALEVATDATLPYAITTDSRIPSAAGLGSSAALSVATVAALLESQGKRSEVDVARLAYEVEWRAQGGRGSPTDTTTSAHGSVVLVDRAPHAGLLWEIARGDRRWYLHHQDAPDMTFVVGNTMERGRTADQVAKVAAIVKRGGFAKEILREIGDATRAGLDALARQDPKALGGQMDRAHNLLTILGVSTPKLNKLVEVARTRGGAYGAKLTGSGGGGSMIALTDDPDACAQAIARAGGTPYVLKPTSQGVRIE